MKKTSKHFRKSKEKLKTFKQTRIFSLFLFFIFAPMFVGSLVFVNNQNSTSSETTFSEGQNDANSAEEAKVLTVIRKEK